MDQKHEALQRSLARAWTLSYRLEKEAAEAGDKELYENYSGISSDINRLEHKLVTMKAQKEAGS